MGNVKIVLTKHLSDDETVAISKVEIKIKLSDGSVRLTNLFNGDKVLGKCLSIFWRWNGKIYILGDTGDAVNDVINQNFDLLSKDITPLVEKALQKMVKKLSNKIAHRYTFGQIFPA